MSIFLNYLKGKNEMLHAEIFPPIIRSDVFLLQLSFQVIHIIECYGSSFPIPVKNSETQKNTERQFSCQECPRIHLLLLNSKSGQQYEF